MKLVRLIKYDRLKRIAEYEQVRICLTCFYYEWFEIRRCSVTIAVQICFRVRHKEGSDKSEWLEIKLYTSASGLR